MTAEALLVAGAAPHRRGGPLALALLVLLGASWGLHVALSKALDAQTTTQALAYLALYMSAASAGLVAVGVGAIALGASRPFRPRLAHLRFFLVSASLGYLGPILIELLVAPRIDASAFALIAVLAPLVTVGLAAAVGLERPTRGLALALGCGLGAAVALFGPEALGASGGVAESLGWLAAAFLLPLFYGADNVYIDWAWPRALDVFQVAAAEGVVGLGLTLAVVAGMGVGLDDVRAAASAGGAPLVGLIATSLFTTWVYFYLLRAEGAVFVSFASFVALATGMLAGVVVFGERPTLALAVATALTIAALWLLRAERARRTRAETAIFREDQR